MSVDPDALYRDVWPEYFETQRRDLYWYERLWSVLLRQLELRTEGRRLVEFGSGPGFLLQLARKRGWDPVGVEPSPLARQHSVELGFLTLEKANPDLAENAGISTEVLEHVDDPGVTLAEWREALAPRGLLALSVPNDDNPLQGLFSGLGEQPWVHHTHKHYFNPQSLKRLVNAAGFRTVWLRTSSPTELLLRLPISRHLAWKLHRVWPAPPLLWRLNVGRHVLLVAQKL